MLNSLQSGLSGLKVHQTYLDVIGNNLANANTPGFKSSRITFADLFSETIKNSTMPTSTTGGQNPSQIGMGAKVGSIDVAMTQGAVLSTGRPFDLGIQGEGFFVLSDGTTDYYTRSGAMGIDGDSYLVNLSNGMRVQSNTLQDIQIDSDISLAPMATGNIGFSGSLPALVTGPIAEVITPNSPLYEGTAAQISGSSAASFTLADGDTMTLRVNSGSAQEIEFLAADFTAIGADITNCTAAEIATVINNLGLSGFTASANANALVLTTENTGDAASLDIDDGTGTPASTLGLSLSMVSGTQTAAGENTVLNDLVSNTSDYQNGDMISIQGTDASGLVLQDYFTYGADGTTLGELRDHISSLYDDATCTLDTNGNLVLTADNAGESALSLFVHDHETSMGTTLWPNFSVTTDGTASDQVTTSVSVFDSMGVTHTLTLTFVRNGDSERTWDIQAELQEGDGVVVNNTVDAVRFNEDGSFAAVLGGGNSIDIQFTGLNTSQNIIFDFGTQSKFDGLTQVGDTGSVQISSHDGYGAGSLASMSIESTGNIIGHFSNGQFQTLGQIGLATFSNASGLEKEGDSLFAESVNSGTRILSLPDTGAAGRILAGTLEHSNVDIGQEFVSLIEAQRGFQANARIITTIDEVLAEMVNLV